MCNFSQGIKNKGIAIGREEGRAEGMVEGIIETAKNLISMNFPLEQIAEATKLPVGKIKELQSL